MKRLPLILFLLFLSACATSGDFDSLRKDVSDVRTQADETKKEVDFLKEKTTGIVKEDSLSAIRDSQAEINSRLSEISSNLQELRGRFEEYKYNTEKALRDIVTERDISRAQIAANEAQLKVLKDKLAGLETQSQSRPVEAPQAAIAAKGAAGQEKTPAASGEAGKESAAEKTSDYEAAYRLFKEKKYKDAREKFEAFLKGFPKNKLAGNAQFWIAETYYSEKDYESAILAYETLLKKYPENDKIPSAYYKQGLAFIDIGDRKTGITILKKLIEKYPSSKDAALAKKKLTELQRRSSGKKR